MDNERRLAALELELTSLKDNLREYAKIHQYVIGQAQAFHAAITALIAAHPDPDLLAVQLHQHLARPEAHEVFQANNDERLQGLQAAQSYLLEVSSIAQKHHRKPE
jgi:hypothetical protein